MITIHTNTEGEIILSDINSTSDLEIVLVDDNNNFVARYKYYSSKVVNMTRITYKALVSKICFDIRPSEESEITTSKE